MNDNELEHFLGPDEAEAREKELRSTVLRDLLLFEYAGDRYAIAAANIESVVPWKPPVPIPGADARVGGVIQDRGRIVVVMTHPTGRADAKSAGEARRVIICATPRGRVGLPASTTNAVASVPLLSEPAAFSVHDSKNGPFTYLDPRGYSDRS